MKSSLKLSLVALLGGIAASVYAATALLPGHEIDVSQTPTPTEKAKAVRLAYADGSVFRKAWLFTYADGPVGQQNIYAKTSFDDGATWSAPVLLSRDAANTPTGGQPITTVNSLAFVADNDKPSIFAPPVTSGPLVVVTWNSAYCPQAPAAAGNAGSYANPLQGAGDLNGDGIPDRPYHCVWVATTTDPALSSWDVQQLTNGLRDAIGEVISGSATGNAFALAWQEDPAGLQPGEAEGRGDGGSGSNVTGGTNIWYTRASSPNGTSLRANIVQLSNNDLAGTGQPGASRPNLQISGSTAVVAYEESACPGGSSGKCVVYHAFPYASPDQDSAGTIISDVTTNSRRVRFVLQGASAAGSSKLRTVVLWRESPTLVPAAPADLIVRRGFVDTVARPGSTGFLASDILADTPQNMTRIAASGGNANAHRAIVRGSFIGLAYDETPSMDGANPEKTAVPSANYNLFFTRSTDDGNAGSWSPPVNLSNVNAPALTVVEPRLAPTPGTIVNPLTGTPDVGDAQDPNVLYVSYATETNTLVGAPGRIYLSRSTDQGASFEPFVPVSATMAGQSEAQLRPLPDGSATMVLWMGEQTTGDPATKDALYTVATAGPIPDLHLSATAATFAEGGPGTFILTLVNQGAGDAKNVMLTGSLPNGLTPVGISRGGACAFDGPAFRCNVADLPPSQSLTVFVTVSSATEGSYIVDATATSDGVDANSGDNATAAALSVTLPPPAAATDGGGGCTTAGPDAPFDPALPLLAGLGLAGLALRRVEARRTAR